MKAISSGCGFTMSMPASWPHRLPCTVKIEPSNATRWMRCAHQLGRQHLDDVDQGDRQQRRQLLDADVRRDRRQHRVLGAGLRQPLDEAGEIHRELVEPAGADQVLPGIDIGVHDREVGHEAARLAGSGDAFRSSGPWRRRPGRRRCRLRSCSWAHAGQLRFQTSTSSGRASARCAIANSLGVSVSNQPRLRPPARHHRDVDVERARSARPGTTARAPGSRPASTAAGHRRRSRRGTDRARRSPRRSAPDRRRR